MADSTMNTRLLAAEFATARVLAEADRLEDVAPRILEAICASLEWEYGGLWQVDPHANRLRCVESWHSPSRTFRGFEMASRQTMFERGVGLPGRVWQSGRAAFIPDVVKDSNFPRSAVADQEGLHAAFAFPIAIEGAVVGVMEFFSREIREPDPALLAMLRSVGTQIGQFMERRRAQEELDRFFALSIDLLCVAGFDGYFKRLNPAWVRVLGRTLVELCAVPYLDFVHPDDRAATLAEAEKVAGGATLLKFENRFLAADGQYRWLAWTAVPYANEEIIYAAARDVTEQRLADEQLAQYARDLDRAKAKAEEAARAKAEFLANMSHEIRTPMGAIIGMADLAAATRLTSEQREYVTTIGTEGRALLGIINDILDFSKIEARKLQFESIRFGLRDTVEDAIRGLAMRAQEKGLELGCEIHARVPDPLVGDPGRLKQVVTNLVSNAIKFTDHGEVLVTVDVGTMDADSAVLHFSVADTGIGIPGDKRAKIFEAFAQADSSTTRLFGGTGLGLSIATELVARFGGTISLESEVGRGSTFRFTARFERDRNAVHDSGSVDLRGLPVLIVDDSPTQRRILAEILASWKMTPRTVESGARALAALREADRASRSYALVVLDGEMPRMNGFALAGRIRRDAKLRRLPIVLMSTTSRPGDVGRCRSLKIAARLTKPVKQSDLLDSIMSIFARRLKARVEPEPAPRPASRPLHILVAEDNHVNRQFATRVLEKRGHKVSTAVNGRLAVEAISRLKPRRFDVILMDVQMPELDGLSATALIRKTEETAGGHATIVAMTAHAMAGDRERCLAAGMDDYVTKPLRPQELIEAVERAADRRIATVVAAAVPGDQSAVVFDIDLARTRLGGDRQLLREMITIFRSESRKLMAAIDAADPAGDMSALRIAAHTLKGSLGTVGAPRAFQAAKHLEDVARQQDRARVESAKAALAEEMAALIQALAPAPRRVRATRKKASHAVPPPARPRARRRR